ncbi:MAG: ROK family protein [Micrococcales bacterium]|nr:ROK family protein [Micrococcales bacterium]
MTSDLFTLVVDCGGSGIKASVLDLSGTSHASVVRVPTPYPLPPDRLAETVSELRDRLPAAQRATVGMPGMIRRGVVVSTPHYVNRSGPRTAVVPELVAEWSGCDVRALLSERLGLPTLVLNDAQVHGAGVISGAGVELVLTLGTGLGWALFDGGRVAPHLEMSHAPFTRATTFDSYVGEPERVRLGDGLWSRRVRRVVEHLRPVVMWDRLYLGGGNARRVSAAVLDRLGDDVVVVPNAAGIVGGVRAWNLQGP